MNTEIYRSILSGFKNYAFKSPRIEEVANDRAAICAACPHANPKYPFKMFKDKKLYKIQGLGCDKCGCLISAKVRSILESCPDDPSKW